MWQCPATPNTHPCQLMTLWGAPRPTSQRLPDWVRADSALKHPLAALPVRGAAEVTSVTRGDTVRAASPSHALSPSSIFTACHRRPTRQVQAKPRPSTLSSTDALEQIIEQEGFNAFSVCKACFGLPSADPCKLLRQLNVTLLQELQERTRSLLHPLQAAPQQQTVLL